MVERRLRNREEKFLGFGFRLARRLDRIDRRLAGRNAVVGEEQALAPEQRVPADAERHRHVAGVETAIGKRVQEIGILALQNLGRVGEIDCAERCSGLKVEGKSLLLVW